MADILFDRRFSPIVTGTPGVTAGTHGGSAAKPVDGPSFNEVLAAEVQKQGLTLSKHAAARVQQRGVDVSETNLQRLGEGVRLAREKGLSDALVLVDSTAYLVSAKNSTIITAVSGNELKGNVFTNIDGTVVI